MKDRVGGFVRSGHFQSYFTVSSAVHLYHDSPAEMVSTMETNGDTASLKRKREPKDDPHSLQKKHRHRSRSKPQDAATADSVANLNSNSLAVQPIDGNSGPLQLATTDRLASWKVSKPMGGRMSDIDPIFSQDERSVNMLKNFIASNINLIDVKGT